MQLNKLNIVIILPYMPRFLLSFLFVGFPSYSIFYLYGISNRIVIRFIHIWFCWSGLVFPASSANGMPKLPLYNKRPCQGNSIHTEENKPAAPFDGVTGFFVFLCSCGAEIIENHQNNLWSQSARKYFWLIEPEIIKKISMDFCP